MAGAAPYGRPMTENQTSGTTILALMAVMTVVLTALIAGYCVRDALREGRMHRVAFVVPPGTTWSLPAFEAL